MKRLRTFFSREGGTGAAEFAMILPVALLFLLGIIDVGRYAWAINEYEKATQMGARFAVVTDVVATGLIDESYIGDTSCNGGTALVASQTICKEALGTITCSSTGCSCAAGNCPSDSTSADSAAFNAILARMRAFAPQIGTENLLVQYSGSGIGFAGDPNKPEISPIVTVRLQNTQYAPIVFSPLGGTVPLPDFRYSLTLEDGEGTQSS